MWLTVEIISLRFVLSWLFMLNLVYLSYILPELVIVPKSSSPWFFWQVFNELLNFLLYFRPSRSFSYTQPRLVPVAAIRISSMVPMGEVNTGSSMSNMAVDMVFGGTYRIIGRVVMLPTPTGNGSLLELMNSKEVLRTLVVCKTRRKRTHCAFWMRENLTNSGWIFSAYTAHAAPATDLPWGWRWGCPWQSARSAPRRSQHCWCWQPHGRVSCPLQTAMT